MSSPAPLAAAIIAARKTNRFLAFDAALACADAAAAYAVQAEVAAGLGTTVAGWKVGVQPDGAGWAAPIFACDMVPAGGVFEFAGDKNSVKVEAELGVRFGRDLPPRPGKPYSRDEVLDAVSEIFAGIELVGIRFSKSSDLKFATRLADNFANTAYCAGPGFANFRSLDLSQIRCKLTLDGAVKNDRIGGHQQGDPMTPAVAWANTQADRFGGLKVGQFITTGTLIVPYDLDTSVTLEAELVGVSKVTMRTKA